MAKKLILLHISHPSYPNYRGAFQPNNVMLDKKVLIISYDPVIQKNLKKILEFEGYRCHLASYQKFRISDNTVLLQPVVKTGVNNQTVNDPLGVYDLGIFDMGRPYRLLKKTLVRMKKMYTCLQTIVLVDEGQKRSPIARMAGHIELVKPFTSPQILKLVHDVLPPIGNIAVADD